MSWTLPELSHAGQGSEIDEIGKLAKVYGRLFVVTLGAAGSVAFDGGQHYDCAAVTVDDVADSTGAGDAFAAAFLARYCQDGDVAGALNEGSHLAASVIGRIGSY